MDMERPQDGRSSDAAGEAVEWRGAFFPAGVSGEAPWDREDLFPPKPDSPFPFGYVAGRREIGCSSLEELAAACSRNRIPPVRLVWGPWSGRMFPPEMVPMLAGALEKRAAVRDRLNMALGVLLVLLGAAGGTLRYIAVGEPGLNPVASALLGLIMCRRAAAGMAARRRGPAVYSAGRERVVRFFYWLGRRRVPWTVSMAVVTAAVYGAQSFSGLERTVMSAALVRRAVLEGEAWRMLTGPLLHGGLVHVAFNLAALWYLGAFSEALGGTGRTAAVFLASLLGGALASVCLMPEAASVGISGGIMGLLGFVTVLAHRRKHLLPRGTAGVLLRAAGMVALFGLVAHRYVDNAGHLGGYLAGLASGMLLVPREGGLPLETPRGVALAGALSEGVLLTGAAFAAFRVITAP